MPASKAQRVTTAQRRRQAVMMRLAGADYELIARQLGYASRGAACTDIQRALEVSLEEQARDAEVLRQQELLRLDRIQAGVWPAAIAGDTKSADIALKIIDRRCRLLGLDAPTRLEVVSMGAVEAEIERLSKQLGEADRGVPNEPSVNGLLGGPEVGAAS